MFKIYKNTTIYMYIFNVIWLLIIDENCIYLLLSYKWNK